MNLIDIDVKLFDDRLKVEGFLSRYVVAGYATAGSVGIDLRACIDAPTYLRAGETRQIKTGIAIDLSRSEYAGLILPRSGIAFKHGIVLGNSVGLIDCDFQGEIELSLHQKSEYLIPFAIQPMMRVAQLVLIPAVQARLMIVEKFEGETERGSKGFGSTGTM